MVDVVSPQIRSRMMSGIRGKNTKPEVVVRRALFAAGYRFRLHRRDLPGAPDVVLPSRKIAIFAHGCFWHMHEGCKNSKLPSTRPEFWRNKLAGNVERDRKAIEALLSDGWRVLVVWECATRDPAASTTMPKSLSQWIESAEATGYISGAQPA
ncbi:very short patch repair endonuclease [Variovorax ureilyticus]|uniref:Very short patch repair endonuclease n=1 Tax=Variovorax ureilyticus TaxID=1836198 RepID=A0ABU8VE16_9BURK